MIYPSYTFKKLNFLYTVQDTFSCGIILEGWEVKSLLAYNGDINLAFCNFEKKDFCLLNARITPMKHHILNNKIDVMETRPRVLLLNKSEINKIQSKIHIKGYTCVPSRLYRNDKGKWKLEIALVTGKNTYDKRDSLRVNDQKRDTQRQLKGDY